VFKRLDSVCAGWLSDLSEGLVSPNLFFTIIDPCILLDGLLPLTLRSLFVPSSLATTALAGFALLVFLFSGAETTLTSYKFCSVNTTSEKATLGVAVDLR
jgi:hypothetical protein